MGSSVLGRFFVSEKDFCGSLRCIVNHNFNRVSIPFPQHSLKHLPDNTVEAVLEPLDGLVGVDLVVDTDAGLAATALGDTLTGAGPRNCQHPNALGWLERWRGRRAKL